jgi:hypothetical protein
MPDPSASPGAVRSAARAIYYALRLVVVVAIIAYLAWNVYANREALDSVTMHWRWADLVGALLAGVAAYQCLFLGWLLLLGRSGYYRPGRLRPYARTWWLSYLYRYVPGKVLLVVERARMGTAVGIPAAAGAVLAVIETVLAILAGTAVSLLAVPYYTEIDYRVFTAVAGFVILAIAFLPTGFRLICRTPFIQSRLRDLDPAAFRSRDVLLVAIPYVLHYLLLGTSFFLLWRIVASLAWPALPGLCGIYALSHVLSLLALIAPGGLGVREGALAVQLTRIAPLAVAGAMAIGARIWFTLIELICYFCVLVLARGRREPESFM